MSYLNSKDLKESFDLNRHDQNLNHSENLSLFNYINFIIFMVFTEFSY